MRVLGGPRDVREREQRVGRGLDDRERGAVAGAAEGRPVAGVVAAQLDAEALQDPGRESLEAVVAARRQRQRAALAEHRQADARPGRHAAREDRRLGVLERAQQCLGLGCHRRVPASVGRAAARARARTSSSDRARARALPRGCRRDRGRAASRAPCTQAFQSASAGEPPGQRRACRPPLHQRRCRVAGPARRRRGSSWRRRAASWRRRGSAAARPRCPRRRAAGAV